MPPLHTSLPRAQSLSENKNILFPQSFYSFFDKLEDCILLLRRAHAATQPGHIIPSTMVDERARNSSNTVDMDTDSPMSVVTYLQETLQIPQNTNECSKVQESESFRAVAANIVVGSLTPDSTPSSVQESTPKSCMTSLREHNLPPRTPFADITNTVERSVVHTTKVKGKVRERKTIFENSNSIGKENAKGSTLQSIEAHRTKGGVKDKVRTTNLESNNFAEKGKGKVSNWENAPLKDWIRNLFAEEFSTNKSTDSVLYDEDLEETRFDASYFSEDSDSDMDSADVDNFFDDEFDDQSHVEPDSENINPNESNLQKKCRRGSKYLIPEEYATLGGPSKRCPSCNAMMWHEERVNKNVTKGKPLFPQKYQVVQCYVCVYLGRGNNDHSINKGRGPYIYRLNGQNHHVFGSLIPDDGDTPKFCQLYIYDTANEVSNRLRWVNVSDEQPVHAEVVDGLMQMLDDTNELMKKFRTARDRWENNHICDLKVELKVCRAQNGRENHISASNEVAGVMVGSTLNTTPDRDIIIEPKFGKLQRISYIHPKFMALQYPLLFPNGEDGYHDKIPFQSADLSNLKERDFISMKDFYAYRFQIRPNHSLTTRLGGRLFQQYVFDAFSSIEQTRLYWFRKNQTIMRNELYSHICDSVRKGDLSGSNVGKGVILPAGFVGSKRYMQQNFQDALAVCRQVGHPDIFLTMTTNPLWDEIQKMMHYLPGCKSENSPDIISRVFRLKLDQLTNDIKKKAYFGVCVGEFQKRGLPHVHMLIWLDSKSKLYLKNNVDKFVSAEIPDPIKDPVGYAAVKAFMIHGPCGLQNTKSPCMKGLKCIRHFPQKYSARTTFDESGFPVYRRRRQNIIVNVRNAELDNQWLVPYNRDLLVKYQCHMNIEICCHARSLKYLFKYCLKGHDTATVHVTGKKKRASNQDPDKAIDEIDAYFDGRYICGAESAYRIFGFLIHHRTISVERLPFHLPGKKSCTFHSNQPLDKVADREKNRLSKLEAFFQLCTTNVDAQITMILFWKVGA
ncbi:uncharacterized protein LOC135148453 [Daucus carota subsp. sativus]|uniref:uncharacterized protein LOC135148453 n=1 Tax=Daucus carota subsp. sativus TaxID=79200 RepID=UPI00308352DB